jgi:hypothetical protein
VVPEESGVGAKFPESFIEGPRVGIRYSDGCRSLTRTGIPSPERVLNPLARESGFYPVYLLDSDFDR